MVIWFSEKNDFEKYDFRIKINYDRFYIKIKKMVKRRTYKELVGAESSSYGEDQGVRFIEAAGLKI